MLSKIKLLLEKGKLNHPLEITPHNFIIACYMLNNICYELHITNNRDIDKAILIDDAWAENEIKHDIATIKHDIYICDKGINIKEQTISLDNAYLTFVSFSEIQKTFIEIDDEINQVLNQCGLSYIFDNKLYSLPTKVESNNYRLTIITTVFNNAVLLEQTIQSIINQQIDRKNLQYIIKDACSNDGFTKLMNKYEKFVNRIIVSKDNGLYYGMNEAIDYAQGRFIQFLNSDDCFASQSKVADIISNLKDNNTAYYGEIRLYNDKKKFTQSNYNINDLYKYCAIGHPALFAPRNAIIKAGKFNTRFKISADVWMTITLRKNGCRFEKLDNVYVLFRAGGISSKYKKLRLIEDLKCRFYYHPLNFMGALITLYRFLKDD